MVKIVCDGWHEPKSLGCNFKDDIYNVIDYSGYLTVEYKNRVRFYIKMEVNRWYGATKIIHNHLKTI